PYLYRVIAQNKVGYGAEFPSITVQSVSDPLKVGTVPTAPTSLVATLQAGPQISLTWNDTSANENGFIIERATNGGTFNLLASLAAHAGTGSMTFVDTTTLPNSTYTYRVAAVNIIGSSAYATSANVIIPAVP